VRASILIILTVSLAVRSLYAHDYWLEADRGKMKVGDKATIRLMFGENFAGGTEKPLQEKRTATFRVYGPSRKFGNLLPPKSAGGKPAALIEMVQEGSVLVTMERTAALIRFGRPKFLEYAAQEGEIIGEQELPPAKKDVQETYARYLKTILNVGDSAGKSATRRTGLRYEIVPKANPYQPGLTTLPCKLYFDGKAASGQKVTAIHRENGRLTGTTVLTDSKGNCAFPLAQTGSWLIRSVNLMPGSEVAGPQANYQSYWASLTFRYD